MESGRWVEAECVCSVLLQPRPTRCQEHGVSPGTLSGYRRADYAHLPALQGHTVDNEMCGKEWLGLSESQRLLGALSYPHVLEPGLVHSWTHRRTHSSLVPATNGSGQHSLSLASANLTSYSPGSPAHTVLGRSAFHKTLCVSRGASYLFPHIFYQQLKLSRVFTFLVEEGPPEGSSQPVII